MLKIKDDVDLKELEKFGFTKIEWDESTRPYDQLENNYTTMGIGRKKRDIDFNCYNECADLQKYQDLLYDLIQAGLVEKVEE